MFCAKRAGDEGHLARCTPPARNRALPRRSGLQRWGASGALAALFLCAGVADTWARDLVIADGQGETYELLEQSYGLELPDCGHTVPHITEEFDDELGRYAFVFHAHVDQDDDRCRNSDRQRTELRGRSEGVQGMQGAAVFYQWKLKLPAGFQFSGNFTHLFQIKAYGNGHGSGSPIMTLSAYTDDGLTIGGRIGHRGGQDIDPFLDTWVQIRLQIEHSNGGNLAMTIHRLSDGEVLFDYSGNADMWDDGAGYGAPKFGIYRSLNSRNELRDEQVRFADFCVSFESMADCDDMNIPEIPPPNGGAGPTDGAGGSAGQIDSPDPDPDPEPPVPPVAGTGPVAVGGTGGSATGGTGGQLVDPVPADAGTAGQPASCRVAGRTGFSHSLVALLALLFAGLGRRRSRSRS